MPRCGRSGSSRARRTRAVQSHRRAPQRGPSYAARQRQRRSEVAAADLDLLALPLDALAEIAARLPLPDVLRLASTCKQLRAELLSDEQLWDALARREFPHAVTGDGAVRGVAFMRGLLSYWSRRGIKPHVREIASEAKSTRALDVRPKESRLVTAAVDGVVREFDLASGMMLSSVAVGNRCWAVAARYHPAGILAGTSHSTGNNLFLLERETLAVRAERKLDSSLSGPTLCNVGSGVVIGESSGRVTLFDMSTSPFVERWAVNDHHDGVTSIAAHQNTLLTSGWDRNLFEYDLRSHRRTLKRSFADYRVQTLACRGDRVVFTATDHVLHVIDRRKWQEVWACAQRQFFGVALHRSAIMAVAQQSNVITFADSALLKRTSTAVCPNTLGPLCAVLSRGLGVVAGPSPFVTLLAPAA